MTDDGDEGLLSTKIWGELGRGTWRQFHTFTFSYYFALLSSVKKYSPILFLWSKEDVQNIAKRLNMVCRKLIVLHINL